MLIELKNTELQTIIPLILFLGMFLMAIYKLISMIIFLKSAQKTQAEILHTVRYTKSISYNHKPFYSNKRRDQRLTLVDLEFYDFYGTQITQRNIKMKLDKFRVGDFIAILYHPQNNKKIIKDSFSAKWSEPIIFILFSIFISYIILDLGLIYVDHTPLTLDMLMNWIKLHLGAGVAVV